MPAFIRLYKVLREYKMEDKDADRSIAEIFVSIDDIVSMHLGVHPEFKRTGSFLELRNGVGEFVTQTPRDILSMLGLESRDGWLYDYYRSKIGYSSG